MRWLWGTLFAIVVLARLHPADAQITGTVNLCGGSITFTSGSATSDTNTSCNPIETYTYSSSASTAPYGSSLYIPAIPNSSSGTLQHIPANTLLDTGSTQTATGAKTFSGGVTVTTGFTATGLVTAADLFGTTGSGGNVVLATSPTIASPTITGTVTGSGILAVGNLVTASQSTTVNGQTCTLAASCTITATATNITVGTTGVLSGTNGDIEFNNNNVLGEKAVTGSGNVVEATSPTVSGLTVTGSLTATGLVTNSALAAGTFSNITGVGTLTAGTWNATAIGTQYGGTGANLSATGGANQVVQQTTAGGAFTVGQLSATNLSNGVTGSGAVVLATGPTLGASTFSAGITASGLATSGTIANSVCQTSAGVLLSINAANCFAVSGAVSSVAGTAGQVLINGGTSPATGAVVASLPGTLTPSETASGEWQFTGGAVVPPVTAPCGASITPTIAAQNIECTVTAATTVNIPSPFVAGENHEIDLLQGATPFRVTLAPNITVPSGGVATLQQPQAGDDDLLVCKTKVVAATNTLACGQLLQLRQPPVFHAGCNNSVSGSVSSISCTLPSAPPIGAVVLVGFDAGSGTTTSLYSSATFSGGTCVSPPTPANGFIYNGSFTTGYYLLSCQVTSAGATALTINFTTSVTGADLFADWINNSFGIDASNMNTTATVTSQPTAGTVSPNQQDLIWGWLRCGSCGTVTAGAGGFTLGQNVANIGQTEWAILPAGGAPAAVFNAGTAAGYAAGVLAVLP